MPNNPRAEVLRFASHMETKLRANADKCHWREDNLSLFWFFAKASEEMKELMAELTVCKDRDFRFNMEDELAMRERIISECADVANFVMMIADTVDSERPERTEILMAGKEMNRDFYTERDS